MDNKFQQVIIVGFELKSNPLDDHGIECVCENAKTAQQTELNLVEDVTE